MKFTLASTEQVQGEGRKEDAYTYVSEDGTMEVKWRWHSKAAFRPIVIAKRNMTVHQMTALIDQHVKKGMDQHDFAGGFDEAIKVLDVPV